MLFLSIPSYSSDKNPFYFLKNNINKILQLASLDPLECGETDEVICDIDYIPGAGHSQDDKTKYI